MELSLLPPCLGNLQWQTQRANYVAYIGRNANSFQLELDPPVLHGWNEDCTLRWMDEFFPSSIHRVLISANVDYDSDEEDEDDEEEMDCEDDGDIVLEDFS